MWGKTLRKIVDNLDSLETNVGIFEEMARNGWEIVTNLVSENGGKVGKIWWLEKLDKIRTSGKLPDTDI